MLISVGLVVLGGVGALMAQLSSRQSRLSRFANSLGVRFYPEKENIITEITANKMDYFTQYVHRFENVLTFSQAGTFVRIGDDFFYPDGKPKNKQQVTLLSAELMMNHFPYLKIEPSSHATYTERYVPVRTNIEEIDKHYNIFLPPDTALNLSAAMSSFLRAQKGVYIELADNVCVMHTYKMLDPEEIQTFRFRAMQLISDLEIVPPKEAEKNKKGEVDAGTRAEAMVAALMASHARPAAKKKTSSGVLIILILVIMGGMLFFAYYFLKHMVAR